MSAASNYLENAILNHVLKNTALTQPTNLFVGLFKNVSNAASTNLEAGTLTDEVAGGAYARKSAAFTTASGGNSVTSATITFDAATADWGTITHVAIMDALTNGNVLFWGAVATAKTIEIGDTFQIGAGNLSVNLA